MSRKVASKFAVRSMKRILWCRHPQPGSQWTTCRPGVDPQWRNTQRTPAKEHSMWKSVSLLGTVALLLLSTSASYVDDETSTSR
jgi:hypothetical protein